MKKSSKKLLFYLGQVDETVVSLDASVSQYILPELSVAGTRSLLYLLNKNFLLEIFTYQKGKQLRITASGMRQLKGLFPAFFTKEEVEEQWSCIVFIKPPKSDKAFRRLRYLVLAEGAQTMTRGVYLKPGPFSDSLLKTCEEFYKQAVSLFTVGNWIFGFDSLNLLKKMAVDDQLNSLSGISKEVDQLLDNFLQNKIQHHQQKKQIVALLERFYELALTVNGTNQLHLSQEFQGKIILQHCQKLLKLL